MTGVQIDRVKSLFEEPQWYFNRRSFDIRIRTETVLELSTLSGEAQILDIGCGDGSISYPLLTEKTRLTLLDFSSSMLAAAKSNVPPAFSGNVDFVNRDFMDAMFVPQSFDLILCIGVLAHVVSPADFIAKMVSLLKPNGKIIVECTDSSHFMSGLVSPVETMWALIRPSKHTYDLNAITYSGVVEMLGHHGLRPTATFRYGAPLPGTSRFLSQESLYKVMRSVFGTLAANRNKWLGNEYISLFTPLAFSSDGL